MKDFTALDSILLLHLHSSRYEVYPDEALPGVWGNRRIRPFISGEQGNKSLKLKGTGNKGNFGEQGT